MGFIFRPRYKVMQYLIDSNITSLVYDRGTKLQEINNIFISNKMIDHHLVGSGSYISPLYIKEDLESKSILKENFMPNFRAFIDSKYDTHFSPEQILGYIYAVLFHKGYKEKYIDFLKQDFPKVHFVESKETFLKLSKLGSKIIGLHLLDSNMLNEINNEIGKGKYERDKE